MKLIYISIITIGFIQLGLAQNGTAWWNHYYWTSIQGNTPQLIQQRGFRAENHTVVTPDGYVLQIYRIVNPNRSANSTHFGYPIILLSGFLLASEGYLDNADAFLLPQNGLYTEFENNFQNRLQFNCLPNVRPERSGRSLPYTLAACGYDVWLPNLRDAFGYASHLVLSQSRDPKYWDVTLDSYTSDVKSIIDYVLQIANTPTVAIVCHSISCNTVLQLLAEYQTYNHLLKPVFHLAPSVYFQTTASPILILFSIIEPLLKSLFMSTPDIRSIRPVVSDLIQRNSTVRLIFIFLFSFIGGVNPNELDLGHLYRVPAHFPANAAYRVLAHAGQRRTQASSTDLLHKFDYGPEKNQAVYGQPEPKSYDLRRVSNRNMVLFTGSNDFLADYLDIQRLIRVLLVPFMTHLRNDYSHSDFIFARSVNVSVNLPILQMLHQLQLNYN